MSEDPGELQRFYTETVEPLVAYDAQYETDLVQTLETFLECDGNVAGTAQRLYTHRHTVRYRLERVRDLSGSTSARPTAASASASASRRCACSASPRRRAPPARRARAPGACGAAQGPLRGWAPESDVLPTLHSDTWQPTAVNLPNCRGTDPRLPAAVDRAARRNARVVARRAGAHPGPGRGAARGHGLGRRDLRPRVAPRVDDEPVPLLRRRPAAGGARARHAPGGGADAVARGDGAVRDGHRVVPQEHPADGPRHARRDGRDPRAAAGRARPRRSARSSRSRRRRCGGASSPTCRRACRRRRRATSPSRSKAAPAG